MSAPAWEIPGDLRMEPEVWREAKLLWSIMPPSPPSKAAFGDNHIAI